MADYRRRVGIKDAGKLVLEGLAFEPGQQVEVWVRSEEDRAARCRELADLLRETQALPAARSVTEDEIRQELAAHRDGR